MPGACDKTCRSSICILLLAQSLEACYSLWNICDITKRLNSYYYYYLWCWKATLNNATITVNFYFMSMPCFISPNHCPLFCSTVIKLFIKNKRQNWLIHILIFNLNLKFQFLFEHGFCVYISLCLMEWKCFNCLNGRRYPKLIFKSHSIV